MSPTDQTLITDALSVADKIDDATRGKWRVSDDDSRVILGPGYSTEIPATDADSTAIITARNEAPSTIRALAARLEEMSKELDGAWNGLTEALNLP